MFRDYLLYLIHPSSFNSEEALGFAFFWCEFVFVVGATLLVSIVEVPFVYWLFNRRRWVRPNSQGKLIPSSIGIGIVPVALFAWLFYRSGDSSVSEQTWCLLGVVVGFGFLGLIDDVWGDRRFGGLRGHFQQLFVNRKLTTGAVKAFGGLALSFGAASLWMRDYEGSLFGVVVATVLISLCANTINLLDVRPGRALKGATLLFLLLFLVPYSIVFPDLSLDPSTFVLMDLSILLPALFAPLLIYAFLDFRSKAMMGDAGSNALGALVGWCAMTTLSLPGQVIAAALLIAFHLWTEKYSLTEFLARHPVLDWLDRVGTGRPKENLPDRPPSG